MLMVVDAYMYMVSSGVEVTMVEIASCRRESLLQRNKLTVGKADTLLLKHELQPTSIIKI